MSLLSTVLYPQCPSERSSTSLHLKYDKLPPFIYSGLDLKWHHFRTPSSYIVCHYLVFQTTQDLAELYHVPSHKTTSPDWRVPAYVIYHCSQGSCSRSLTSPHPLLNLLPFCFILLEMWDQNCTMYTEWWQPMDRFEKHSGILYFVLISFLTVTNALSWHFRALFLACPPGLSLPALSPSFYTQRYNCSFPVVSLHICFHLLPQFSLLQ